MTLSVAPGALQAERERLVVYGRRLAPDGLAIGPAGNRIGRETRATVVAARTALSLMTRF